MSEEMELRIATVLKLNFNALVASAELGRGDDACDEVAERIVKALSRYPDNVQGDE